MNTITKQFVLLLAIAATALFPNKAHAERFEFSIPSAADSLPISVCIATPPQNVETKAVVQLVHGMCEHKERYYPFMDFLTQNGYACIIHDHRGHGGSVQSTDDLGYFYEAGYLGMIDDVLTVGNIAREKFPQKPFFLFGHSMGSMVVRAYTKRYDNTIDGLIVCGSPSYNAGAAIGESLAANYAKKYGGHYRPVKLQKLSFGSFNKKFKEEASPNAWICSDPEIVAAYDANPLCNYQFTANGFENLFALMQDAYGTKDWNNTHPTLPVWFISGEDDPCLINTGKFKQAVKRMEKAGYTDVTYKLYPDMRHEILNEKDKEIVWNDILNHLNEWLNAESKQ